MKRNSSFEFGNDLILNWVSFKYFVVKIKIYFVGRWENAWELVHSFFCCEKLYINFRDFGQTAGFRRQGLFLKNKKKGYSHPRDFTIWIVTFPGSGLWRVQYSCICLKIWNFQNSNRMWLRCLDTVQYSCLCLRFRLRHCQRLPHVDFTIPELYYTECRLLFSNKNSII